MHNIVCVCIYIYIYIYTQYILWFYAKYAYIYFIYINVKYAIYFCLLQNMHVNLLIQNAYKYSYKCNPVCFMFMAKYTYIWIFIYLCKTCLLFHINTVDVKFIVFYVWYKIYIYICIYICMQSINIDYENIFEIYSKYLHNYLCKIFLNILKLLNI